MAAKTTVLLNFGSGPSTVVGPTTAYIRAVAAFPSGNKVILPGPGPIALVDGQGTALLDGGIVWEFIISAPSYRTETEYRYVPESANPIQYKDLLVVARPPANPDGAPDWAVAVLTAVADAQAAADLIAGSISGAAESATSAAGSASAALESKNAAQAVGTTNDTIIAGQINAPASATRGALDATFGAVFTPETYGASATLSAASDTTFVQAAITAAVAGNGIVRLSRLYRATGLAASGPLTIVGSGGMVYGDDLLVNPVARSGFLMSSGTASGLTITAGPGSVLRDFAIINDTTTAPTAGVGLRFVGNGASSQVSVSGVSIVGFYDNAETSGVFFTFTDCRFYDQVRYGLFQNNTGTSYYDHGDFGVVNSVFAQLYSTWGAVAALRWESGGGVRFVGNKVLGGVPPSGSAAGHFDYCLDFMAADNVSTGDVTCTGNSLSNFNIAGIRVGLKTAAGTGGFINTSIVGNLINVGYGAAVAMLLGAPNADLANNIRGIHVADNIIDNVNGGGLFAYNMKALTVGINTWQNTPGPAVTLGGSPDAGYGLQGARISAQNIGPVPGDLVRDLRRLTNTPGFDGVVEHSFVSTLYSNAVGTWVTLGYLDLPLVNGGAAEVELALSGYDYGFGPMYARYRRILVKVEGSNTVTVVTDGTDAIAGAGTHYDVRFLTTTVNRVIVQVQLTTAGVTIWGKAQITMRGDIELSHKGS